jgi:hypothetical protein
MFRLRGLRCVVCSSLSVLASASRTAALVALVTVSPSCRQRVSTVTVAGTDYAFQAPDTLLGGRTRISFQNRGRVPHELVMALLKPGISFEQLLERLHTGGDPQEFLDAMIGVLIARPAQASGGELLVDLIPGRTYAIVCQFRDGEGQPPHVILGMHKRIMVR